MIDFEVVILCHNEGWLIYETFVSVLRAIDFLRIGSGLDRVDSRIIFAMDAPSNSTIEAVNFIDSLGIINTTALALDFRDPGLSRNRAIEEVSSEYVFIIDGDDLISSDLINSFSILDNKNCIFHPEYLVNFGEKNLIWRQPMACRIASNKTISVCFNPYDTCSIGPTSLYRLVEYAEARQDEGYGYEDWHFTLESNLHDVPHDILPGTIKYTRIKPLSRLKNDKLLCSMLPYSAYLDLVTAPG